MSYQHHGHQCLDLSYSPLPYHSHTLPAMRPLMPGTADTPTPPPDYRLLPLLLPREQPASSRPISAHLAPRTQYAIPTQTSILQISSPSNLLYQSLKPDKQEAPRAQQLRGKLSSLVTVLHSLQYSRLATVAMRKRSNVIRLDHVTIARNIMHSVWN